MRKYLMCILAITALCFNSCGSSDDDNIPDPANEPKINIAKISSANVEVGDEMIIDGSFLSATGNSVELEKDQKRYPLTILQDGDKRIKVSVPEMEGGIYSLIVRSKGKEGYFMEESVIVVKLRLNANDPRIRCKGDWVELTGMFLIDGKTSIFLNDTEMEVTDADFTKIQFKLPQQQASGHYNLTVKTGKQTVTDYIYVCRSYWDLVVVKTDKPVYSKGDRVLIYGMNLLQGKTDIIFEGNGVKLIIPAETDVQAVFAEVTLPGLPEGSYDLYAEVNGEESNKIRVTVE